MAGVLNPAHPNGPFVFLFGASSAPDDDLRALARRWLGNSSAAVDPDTVRELTIDTGAAPPPPPPPGPTCDAGPAGPCEGGPPAVDPGALPECYTAAAGLPLCERARCVPGALVPANLRDFLVDCEDGGNCVPDDYVVVAGLVHLPECRSLAKREGRCVSVCIPLVSEGTDIFPRDTCRNDERCVPCFWPDPGIPTGACGIGCDPGPRIGRPRR